MKIQTIIALLFTMQLFSQNSKETKAIYTLFDQTIHLSNTSLSYGKLYQEQYRTLNDNHQYLSSREFTKGNVTYQNQTFYEVDLKYDISEDFLIVHIEEKSIVLEKAMVTTFTLLKKTLEHIEKSENTEVTNYKYTEKNFINNIKLGYLEFLYGDEQLAFYKKNKKNRRKKLNESFVYYKYLENPIYYLEIGNEFYEVKNKKDLIKYFPKYKKLINNTYKTHRKLAQNQKDNFYPLLGKTISNAIKNSL